MGRKHLLERLLAAAALVALVSSVILPAATAMADVQRDPGRETNTGKDPQKDRRP
jgi:hypothetical protein